MAGGGPGGGRPLAPPLEAGRRGSAIYRKPCFPACYSPVILFYAGVLTRTTTERRSTG